MRISSSTTRDKPRNDTFLLTTPRYHANRYAIYSTITLTAPLDQSLTILLQLVRRLCDLKQGYTQHGGLRPFGVSFIYAGYDTQRGFQLYQSNPSGNYGGWKATSVGKLHNHTLQVQRAT